MQHCSGAEPAALAVHVGAAGRNAGNAFFQPYSSSGCPSLGQWALGRFGSSHAIPIPILPEEGCWQVPALLPAAHVPSRGTAALPAAL